MIVYKIHGGESSFFTLKEKTQIKSLRSALKGKNIDWKELEFSKENKGSDSTFSSFGGVTFYGVNDPKVLSVLKNKCNEVLTSINYVENDFPFFILTDIKIVDAIDLKASEYEALDENRILFIDKYILKSNLIEGLYLFRLKRYNSLFCTNIFKELYEKEKWSGFLFEKVWEKDLLLKKQEPS